MLSGVVVLELGQVIAGNFGGVILADLGAEIIKIEPKTGDTARNATIAPLHDESAIHLFMNRGKKSVVLDLKDPRGLEMFFDLVEQADVIVDNFRPGVMARLGIDHDSLKERNPDIITSSVTGFGEYGPVKDKAAFDLVVQAYSGHVDITGPADGDPARVGIPSPTSPAASTPASRCWPPWSVVSCTGPGSMPTSPCSTPLSHFSLTTRWTISTRAGS
jgi:crotonobetainyl-CoA:carnitine CoA-transferase CaiB-like acyl-CoA transferase